MTHQRKSPDIIPTIPKHWNLFILRFWINVLVTSDDVTYDHVIWPAQGSLTSSCTCFVTELHLNRYGHENLSWMLKNKRIRVWRFETGTIHQLECDKVITQQLMATETCHSKTLLNKIWKKAWLKKERNQTSIETVVGRSVYRAGLGWAPRRRNVLMPTLCGIWAIA